MRAPFAASCCPAFAVGLAVAVAVGALACAGPLDPPAPAPTTPTTPTTAPTPAAPGAVWFEENTGRFGAGVRFVAHGVRGGDVVIGDRGFAVVSGDRSETLRLDFAPATAAAARGEGPLSTVVRRYVGDQAFAARAYAQVVLPLRAGVDVVVYGTADGDLEYDWRFAAGVRGAAEVWVDGSSDVESDGGDLVVGGLRVGAPRSFVVDAAGRASPVASALRRADDAAGARGRRFVVDVGAHDVGQRLVVDPVVKFQGTVGGSGAELRGDPFRFDAPGAGVDKDGNVFFSGTTTSPDLPVSENAVQRENQSGLDAFVGSVTADGRAIRWLTYISTNAVGGDQLRPLAVDRKDGSVVLAVRTAGIGFPVTEAAAQREPGGGVDTGLVKLDNGGKLLAGTLFGGPAGEFPYAVTVDVSDGTIVVGGITTGRTLATDGTFGLEARGTDGFVAVFAPDLGKLQAATHVGSDGSGDAVLGLHMRAGVITLTGQVDGKNVPGARDEPAGGLDALVLQTDRGLTRPGFARVIGSPGNDRGFGVGANENGVYVAGLTEQGRQFPLQDPLASGSGGLDGFVLLLAPDGGLKRATLLAGEGEDFLGTLALFDNGDVVVGGSVRGAVGFGLVKGCGTDGREEGLLALLSPELSPRVVTLLDPPVRNVVAFDGSRVAFVGETAAGVVHTEGAVRGGGGSDVAVAVVELGSDTDALDCIGDATPPAGSGDADLDFVNAPVDPDDANPCVPDDHASACKDDDKDGLGGFEEVTFTGTSPNSGDSDGDGVDDKRQSYARALFALKCAVAANFEAATPCAISLVDRGGFSDIAVVTLDGAAIAVDGLAFDRQRRLFAFRHVGAQSQLVELDRPTARARVVGELFDGTVTGAAFLARGPGFDRGEDVITGVVRDRATGGLELVDVKAGSGFVAARREVIGVSPQTQVASPFDIAVDHHGAAWLLAGSDGSNDAFVGVIDVDSGVVRFERPFRFDNGSGGPLGLAFDVDEVGVAVVIDANGSEDVDRIDLCSGRRTNLATNLFAAFNAGNADLAQAPPDKLTGDDDADGVPTALEIESALACSDADGDGVVDAEDGDSDDDGRGDGDEDTNQNGVVDAGESDPRNSCDPDLTRPGCSLADDDGDCIVDAVAGRSVDVGGALFLASGSAIFAFDPRDPAAGPQLSCSSPGSSGIAVDVVGGVVYAGIDAGAVVEAHDAATLARRPALDLDLGVVGGAIAVDATGRTLYRLTRNALLIVDLDDDNYGALLQSLPLPGTPIGDAGSLGLADGHALAVDVDNGLLYVALNEHDPRAVLALPLRTAFNLPLDADALRDTGLRVGLTGGVGVAFGDVVTQDQGAPQLAARANLTTGLTALFQSRLSDRSFSSTNLSFSAWRDADDVVRFVEVDGGTGEVFVTDDGGAPVLFAGASGRGVFAIGHVDGDAFAIDRDDDGVTDLDERDDGTDPDDADFDDDGVVDGADPDDRAVCVPDASAVVCDADRDGVFGEADVDSDGDGVNDAFDVDDDDDGVLTADETVDDQDGDGTAGYLDPSERGDVVCGDGVADCAFEACDDGNDDDGDGCDALCQRDAPMVFFWRGGAGPGCQQFAPNGVPGSDDTLVFDADSPDFRADGVALALLRADDGFAATISGDVVADRVEIDDGAFDVDALTAREAALRGGRRSVDLLTVTDGTIDVAGATVVDVVVAGNVDVVGDLVVDGDLTFDSAAVEGVVTFAAAGNHDVRCLGDARLRALAVRGRATVRPLDPLHIIDVQLRGGVLALPLSGDVVVDNVVVDDGVFAPARGAVLQRLTLLGGVAIGSDGLRLRQLFRVDGGRFIAGATTSIGASGGSVVVDTGTVRFNALTLDGDEVVFSDRSDLRVQALTASGVLRGADVVTGFAVGDAARGQWSILAGSAAFPAAISVRDSLNLDVVPLEPAQFTDLGNNTRWGPQANPPRCGDLDGVFGPVVLVDDAAVAAFNDSGVQCVDGDLEIGADVTSVELVNLVVITGTLRVRGSGVASVVLPVLTNAGAVDVGDNDALVNLELPALVDVTDAFIVEDNDALVTLTLPVIENVGGDLFIGDNDALTDVSAPALASVGGDLIVEDNDALDDLALPVLVTVDGDLQLLGNPDLVALLLPLLEDIGGSFTIVDNDGLVTVTAPALAHVGGDLVISDNDAIDDVDLSPVVGVGGNLDISDDVVIADCGNGVVEDGEACDDDDTDDGDGCDAGCAVEAGFACAASSPSVCARDRDGDGVIDVVDDCVNVDDADQADGDGDGVGDACDSDTGNGGGAVAGDGDGDGDGIDDGVDNCDVRNADQSDVDGDGDGDACDDDADGDGGDDPCPLQADVVDCADDEDGDGLADEVDPCPVTAGDAADDDGDGIGDGCDADDDDDGVADGDDNCATDENAAQEDADADGRGDACDLCPGVAGPRDGCLLDPPPPPPPDDDGGAPEEGCAQAGAGAFAPVLLLVLLLRRRRQAGVALVLGVLVGAGAAEAATFTGAVSSDANDGANWDSGSVPTGATAVFPAGAPAATITAALDVDTLVVGGSVGGAARVSALNVVVASGGDCDVVVDGGGGASLQIDAGGRLREAGFTSTQLATVVNDGVIGTLRVGTDDGAVALTGSGVVDAIRSQGVVLWSSDDAAIDVVDNAGLVVFDGHDVVTGALANGGVISGAASITIAGSGDVVLGTLADRPALSLLPTGAGLVLRDVDVVVSALRITGSSEVRFDDVDAAVRVTDSLVLRGEAGAPLTVRGPVSLEIPADDGAVDADHIALAAVTVERGLFIDAADFTDLGGNRGFGAPPAACGDAPAFVGDVVLATDDEVAAFEASGIECVDGDVVFGRDVVDAVLTHLTRVTGRISIRDGLVQQIALTALVDAGAIDIAGNEDLVDIDLPVLDAVADDVFIGDNDALVVLSLPALLGVGGDLEIAENDALEDVGAPLVANVGGDLIIDDNDALADVDFTVLAIVDGDIVAIDNDVLLAILLEALAEVGGSVVITGNDALEDVGLDAVASVGGDLIITDNDDAAAAPDLGSLENVGGNLEIDGEADFPDGTVCDNVDGCHPLCGDAAIVGDESCDDGNAEDGDGCDADCHVEAGFVCGSAFAGGCRRDGDGDGVIDDADVCARVGDDQADRDGDGLGDACDDDDDGDGRADADDDCDGADADHRDGDCEFVSDVDGDGDGIVDDEDVCADFADVTGGCGGIDCAGPFDCDDDGVDNEDDLCPTVADQQRDDDGDGLGNDCDSDDDGDGVPDFDDACPNEFDPTQACGQVVPDPPDDDDDDDGGCAAGGPPIAWALLLLFSRRRPTSTPDRTWRRRR